MDKNFIENAAKLFYKENVEGEPLDQDTPTECFIAGANFILNAQKKHQNKCNISNYSSYNIQNSNMKLEEKYIKKILSNISKIMKITGFYITAPGDPSVGIYPSTWKLENDFYFDNQEELEEFRKELKNLFEFYCGEATQILTFEEHQQEIEADEQTFYDEFPMRYLLRDKESYNNYKQANSTASYSSAIGTAIHSELPSWIPEKGNTDTEVIKSTDPKFKQILLLEAERLEREINNDEYRLNNAKMNLRIIQKELKLGQK